MNPYSIFLAAAGALCPGGPPLAPKAAIQPIQVIEAECEASAGIGLSPDGKRVFCFDHWTVHQIDLGDGKEGKKLPLPQKLRGEKIYTGVHVQDDVWPLALSRSKYLTDADGYKTRFVLFDFATGAIQADWAAHKDIAAALAVAPKQNWFVTAGDSFEDHTVCFWDRKTLKKVREVDLVHELRLQPPRKGSWVQIERMAIDPTASFLAFGFHGGMIQVSDLDKKTWHPVLREGEGVLRLLRFLDSRTLAARWTTALDRDLLEVYDWRGGKLLFQVERKGIIPDIVPSPDGRIMALGDWGRDGSWVRLWDVAAKREVSAFKAYDDGMRRMTFTHDGKRLVTSGRDGKIKVWDVERIVKSSQP